MKIELNLTQIEAIIDALNSALTGDPTEGDFCWRDGKIGQAEKALEKLQEAYTTMKSQREGE